VVIKSPSHPGDRLASARLSDSAGFRARDAWLALLRVQRAGGGPGARARPGANDRLKPGLKERRRLVREAPDVRGRWALFPRALHPDRAGSAIAIPGEDNVLRFARSEFLYVTSRTRGSRDEQHDAHRKRQGSLWSQRNLYRDIVEPAREAAGVSFTLYDARHTFVSTLMAAGVPLPEVAAYSGHSVGELAAVAAGDGRLRSQTTLAVYTHATGQAREHALEAVGTYLEKLLAAAPRLRAALAS
jgi:hypothetical protein